MSVFKKILLSVFICAAYAQLAGNKIYPILELPFATRSIGMGGNNISMWGDDANMALNNPALLNTECSKQIFFNFFNLAGSINSNNIGYSHSFEKYGSFMLHLNNINYGKIDERNEFDQLVGTFSANDYLLTLSYAKKLQDKLSIGVALKSLVSQYHNYTYYGAIIDAGLTYHNQKELVMSIVAKNFGMVWNRFSSKSSSNETNSNVQVSISKKLPHAPFRLICTYDQLLNWDLSYSSSLTQAYYTDPFTKVVNQPSASSVFFDNLFKHLIIGTEIGFTKNFHINVAYSYRKSSEMALSDYKAINGLSFGLGLQIKKIHFEYAFSQQSISSSIHSVGLKTSLNYFIKSN